jgi:FkbM family methyltransferase
MSLPTQILKGVTKKAGSLLHNPNAKINVNWLGEKLYKHMPDGKVRSHTLFGKKIYFSRPSEFLYGLKEIFIKEPYKQTLGPKPYIIDCGSHIGLSVIYMKELAPGAEIEAFEPDNLNFDLLTRNVASFGFQDVRLHKEAVWKEDTVLRFANDNTMGSRISEKGGNSEVKAVRLKGYLNRTVDFLKMDIEGAEYEVIMDIADQLHNVRNLFIEYHGRFDQMNELLGIYTTLNRLGFDYYIKEATVLYQSPFYREQRPDSPYDVQLNIFSWNTRHQTNS